MNGNGNDLLVDEAQAAQQASDLLNDLFEAKPSSVEREFASDEAELEKELGDVVQKEVPEKKTVATQAPTGEPKAETPPGDDVEKAETEQTEETEAVDEALNEESTEDGAEQSAEVDELSERERELAEREQRVLDMLNQFGKEAVTKAPIQEAAATPEAQPQSIPAVKDTLVAVGNELLGLDEEQSEKFAVVMDAVIQQTRQSIMQELPVQVARQVNNRQVVTTWFNKEENKDLIPVLDYVRKVAIDVEAENPGFAITQVLEEAGKRVREIVGKVKSTKSVAKPAAKPAGFAPGTGQRTVSRKPTGTKPGTNSIADEFEQMKKLF